MSLLILVVDDEPDVETLFRQQFGATSALAASRWSLRVIRWGPGPNQGLNRLGCCGELNEQRLFC